jgi:hemerythrin-like metal-binding protein
MTETKGRSRARRTTKAAGPRVAQTPATSDTDEAIALLQQLAKGDLHWKVDPARAAGSPLLQAVQQAGDNLVRVLGEISMSGSLMDRGAASTKANVKALYDMVVSMRKNISEAASTTEGMRHQMATISASTEELNANMQSISGAAAQSNDHVGMVGRSISELTTASREIAANTARATAISKKAMADVTSALSLVEELNEAAKAIDAVTATISEISDQTKLLALNATIEAARAGEMGKGFAVVAKEVKDLASQTNSATKGIQGKISIIHEVSQRTSDAIRAINSVMTEVNAAVTSIAAATEEQSATTDSIRETVTSTSERIKEVSNNVHEGAIAVGDVTKTLLEVTQHSMTVAKTMSELDRVATVMKVDAASAYARDLEVLSLGADIKRVASGITLTDHAATVVKNAVPELCHFSSEFDVMSEAMNDDHRRIFAYINAIHHKIKEKKEFDTLFTTFKELYEFSRAHFQREEENMQAAQYVGFPQQKAAHENLLGRVRTIIASMERGEEVDLLEAMSFLQEWLIKHILVMDRQYGPTFREHGIR